MIIDDPIYGKINIAEPVLVELIESPAMQRIKGIEQEFTERLKVAPGKNYTRFEHSVGVWFLARYFKAPLEEQIAALLHDVSHTAFSHTIDLVLGNEEKADFHDLHTDTVISKSNIPNILNKYNYDTGRVTDPKNFPILEQELPALCADRLDYSLRTFFHRGIVALNFINKTLKALTIFQKKIVFIDQAAALNYAKTYLKTELTIWDGSPQDVARQKPFAEILKKALGAEQITIDDFFRATDDELLEKLTREQKNAIDNIKKLKPKLCSQENHMTTILLEKSAMLIRR